jgi:hypothetical protein
VPPPGQSPSGSSSSLKEGQGPGGFPFGWPDGPPIPSNPGGTVVVLGVVHIHNI